MEKLWVLYDGRGEEDGQVACCARSVREVKQDSKTWPQDYQWWEHDIQPGPEPQTLLNARFHSFAGDHWRGEKKKSLERL